MPFGKDIPVSPSQIQQEHWYNQTSHESVYQEAREFFRSLAPEEAASLPELHGGGPLACSTAQDLVPCSQGFSWDVNGYYRRLGIPWPYVNATKGQLAKAYIAAGGSASDRITYALTQLLDPLVRAEYDAMPLGSLYMNDVYVEEDLRRAAQMQAQRMRQSGLFTTPEDVLDEWGYEEPEVPAADSYTEQVDKPARPGDDRLIRTGRSPRPTWSYSYWLWNCRSRNTLKLQIWQEQLVSALAEQGARVQLSVGLMGQHGELYAVRKVYDRWVVFLAEHIQPNEMLAKVAASVLVKRTGKVF